jgi:hypothetical protein
MMRIFLILALALIGAGNTAAADIEANDIIRSLAPITYLPEHGGKPRRAIDLEVRFESGSAKLTPEAQRLLDTLAERRHAGLARRPTGLADRRPRFPRSVRRFPDTQQKRRYCSPPYPHRRGLKASRKTVLR